MQIAIPLYPGFAALDAVGPYDVLVRVPDAEVRLVAAEAGPVATDEGLTIVADSSFDDVREPDVLVVPGGFGSRALLEDERILGWIRHAHEHSAWTTSVCTGALLLAAAGALDGVEATTFWNAFDRLESLGARPIRQRVVERGKIITAAGVSAGIDMALQLAARLTSDETAQAIQLGIEYDPQPPFDAGSPQKAPENVVALVREATAARARAASAA